MAWADCTSASAEAAPDWAWVRSTLLGPLAIWLRFNPAGTLELPPKNRPRKAKVFDEREALAFIEEAWRSREDIIFVFALLTNMRPSEFTGVEKRAARGGHIPGAVNILWKDALQDDWTLRDANELEEFYTNAGFGPETSTITYCQAGVRAAFTHLVLTSLGHDEVRTYDGSWEEWGNEPDLPIIAGRS